MLFLANENFPGEAIKALRERGHDVAWVHTDAPGMDDQDVLDRAQREKRIVITLDKDFGEMAFRSERRLLRYIASFLRKVWEIASQGRRKKRSSEPSKRRGKKFGARNLHLVLDTNEFIFAYGHERKPSCQALLGEIVAHPEQYELKVSRTIVEEVRRNIA